MRRRRLAPPMLYPGHYLVAVMYNGLDLCHVIQDPKSHKLVALLNGCVVDLSKLKVLRRVDIPNVEHAKSNGYYRRTGDPRPDRLFDRPCCGGRGVRQQERVDQGCTEGVLQEQGAELGEGKR